MTQYTVWLWPGAGVEMEPFTVEASSEQEAVELVGESLRGTGYTIDGSEYLDMLQEYVSDGYGEDEAEYMLGQSYYPINGGEFYLFILNMRIEIAGGSRYKKPRGSANRTVIPYGGGYVSLPGSYNGRPKGQAGGPGVRRQCFTVGGDPTVYAVDVPDVGGYVEAAVAYDRAHGTDFADRVDPSAWFGDGFSVAGRRMGGSVPGDVRVITATSQIGSRSAKPGGRAKGRRGRLFGSRNIAIEDLPEKALYHPVFIPGNELILPNGKFSNAEYEVYLTNDQRPGRVTYRTTVIDEDGLGQDVTFTFELRRFMETPWEALDWKGSITDVSRNTNMDWDMGSFNGKRKDAGKKRRRLTTKNVRYRDLPEKVRQHPGYIPGYTVTLPDGTVAYAEGEVELMDGQVPGMVSYWTNVSDDNGRCYDVAFTFDLGYFMSTPWEALDWSGSITDVIEDPDAGCQASRGIKSRIGRR